MGITKKAANAKYDKLRAQLKNGDISKEAFKAASNRIYKMYHSDANKATRNAPKPKPVAKPKPAAKKPSTAPHNLMKPGVMVGSEDRPQRGYKPGKMYGEDVKPRKKQSPRAGSRANPNRKSLTRKPKTTSRRRTNRRGRRV